MAEFDHLFIPTRGDSLELALVEAATGAADPEPEEDGKDSLADIFTFLPRWQCQYTHVQSIHIHVTAKIAHVQKSRDYAQTMPGLQTTQLCSLLC